jgi:hypothetical protein
MHALTPVNAGASRVGLFFQVTSCPRERQYFASHVVVLTRILACDSVAIEMQLLTTLAARNVRPALAVYSGLPGTLSGAEHCCTLLILK